MKRVFLLVGVALAVGILVLPAFAAQPMHRWTWNWNGFTSEGYDNPEIIDVFGSTIKVSGTATAGEGGPFWSSTGTGVFVDETLGLKAKLQPETIY